MYKPVGQILSLTLVYKPLCHFRLKTIIEVVVVVAVVVVDRETERQRDRETDIFLGHWISLQPRLSIRPWSSIYVRSKQKMRKYICTMCVLLQPVCRCIDVWRVSFACDHVYMYMTCTVCMWPCCVYHFTLTWDVYRSRQHERECTCTLTRATTWTRMYMNATTCTQMHKVHETWRFSSAGYRQHMRFINGSTGQRVNGPSMPYTAMLRVLSRKSMFTQSGATSSDTHSRSQRSIVCMLYVWHGWQQHLHMFRCTLR